MTFERDLPTVLRAIVGPQHYRAAAAMLTTYHRPFEAYRRYLLGQGAYPADIGVRTPLGDISLRLHSAHDMLTLNEVFCRADYPADRDDRVFVDFGSNIGVSAAYFLTRSRLGFAYLFEPVPRNIERLRRNLSFLAGRFDLREAAVGVAPGKVRFGVEETGRYGGLGLLRSAQIEVRCVDSNQALAEVIAEHGGIDILKVDIEGLEADVVTRIPAGLREKIRRIYAEWKFPTNPLAGSHDYRQVGSIARFVRIDAD